MYTYMHNYIITKTHTTWWYSCRTVGRCICRGWVWGWQNQKRSSGCLIHPTYTRGNWKVTITLSARLIVNAVHKSVHSSIQGTSSTVFWVYVVVYLATRRSRRCIPRIPDVKIGVCDGRADVCYGLWNYRKGKEYYIVSNEPTLVSKL